MDKTLKTTIIVGILIFSFSILWFVYEYSKSRPELRTFSVSGEGKEVVVPNIAEIRIGIISEGKDLAGLQKENSEKMNRIISFLKEKGIDEKDVQTENYLVSPKYDYSKSPYRIVSYAISQDLKVKVRDLSNIGEILSQAVNYGANNVYGPNFIVDDKEVYLEKAREKAIKDAKEKAEKIAKTAGFKLGKIVGIQESGPSEFYPVMLEEKIGRGKESLATIQPQIQPGSQEIKVQVNITYEIR
jgi:uncharacterized protein YggE